MRHKGHTLLVAALAIAVIAVVPGGAVAADGLSVTGDQADDGTVTVTVTENNTSVTNATVTVEALNNSTYSGSGNYTTGENGTVELPAPEQNVSVSVTAEANNATAETTLDLVAPTDDTSGLAVGVTQADDGTSTVSVTNGTEGVANASVSVATQDNVTYAGDADYTTDENGTVDLPAPEQNVTVDVTAEANNETASTTATLTVTTASDGDQNLTFGERVTAFVTHLQEEGNVSEQAVSTFVVSNNPGADERPDHAGPPDADGEDDEDDEERGNGNGADGNDGNGNGADGANGNGNGNNGNDEGGNGNGNGNGNGGNGNNGNGDGGPP